jgi:hypothetical protein
MGLTTGVRSPAESGTDFSPCHHCVQTYPGSTQLPIMRVTEAIFFEVKQPEREANHWLQFSDEV